MATEPQAPAKSDAIDDFIALPSDQQLSTLQTLAPDKQDALLAKVKERRGGDLPPSHPISMARGIQNSFDTNTTPSPTEPLLETGLKRVVGTLGAPLIHPLDTLSTLSHTFDYGPSNPLIQRGVEAKEDYQAGGLPYAATKLGGDALGAYLGGKIGEAGVGAVANVPRIVQGAANVVADTGPKTAAKLVADTGEENAAAATKGAEDTSAATAKRAQQLQTHFERTQATQAANDAATAQQSRKVALQRGVETLDPIHKTDLSNLESTVRAEANRRYNELNANLDPEIAPPDTLSDLVSSASEKMKGSNTETPIMKDMEKRLSSGDPLTYRDLQGYRSELGRELQKGSLPGDVYHAYKDMMSDITDHMSDIAKSRGLGDQFDQARSYYKQMSDTFDDPSSPIRRALNSTEPGGVVKAFKGKDKSGIEALAQYDPDLAQRINTTRGYAAEANSIRSSAAQPKPLPTLPPRPPAPVADVTKIGPADIQAAKAEALSTRANKIRTTGHTLLNTGTGMKMIFDLMHGNLLGIGEDALARGAFSAGQHGLAAILEHPAVVNWLTKPTAADLAELAKLPAEQRVAAAQNLQPLISAAQARGLKVAPAITAITASGATLPAGHPLAASQPVQ